MPEIKCMTHNDVYKNTKETALKLYRESEETFGKIKTLRRDLEDLEREHKEQLLTYRRYSADRVMNYLRDEYNKGNVPNLDTYLCHCQNKLNGNIDGTELDLKASENNEP